MSIKVVVNNRMFAIVPPVVLQQIQDNPALKELWQEKEASFLNRFGKIPRHNPELVKIIEDYLHSNPEYKDWVIKTSKSHRYIIHYQDGLEKCFFEEDLIVADILVLEDGSVNPKAYLDYLTPEWKQASPVTWKRFIVDPIQEIWLTFSSQQRLILAKCAAQECQDFFDSM